MSEGVFDAQTSNLVHCRRRAERRDAGAALGICKGGSAAHWARQFASNQADLPRSNQVTRMYPVPSSATKATRPAMRPHGTPVRSSRSAVLNIVVRSLHLLDETAGHFDSPLQERKSQALPGSGLFKWVVKELWRGGYLTAWIRRATTNTGPPQLLTEGL